MLRAHSVESVPEKELTMKLCLGFFISTLHVVPWHGTVLYLDYTRIWLPDVLYLHLALYYLGVLPIPTDVGHASRCCCPQLGRTRVIE